MVEHQLVSQVMDACKLCASYFNTYMCMQLLPSTYLCKNGQVARCIFSYLLDVARPTYKKVHVYDYRCLASSILCNCNKICSYIPVILIQLQNVPFVYLCTISILCSFMYYVSRSMAVWQYIRHTGYR